MRRSSPTPSHVRDAAVLGWGPVPVRCRHKNVGLMPLRKRRSNACCPSYFLRMLLLMEARPLRASILFVLVVGLHPDLLLPTLLPVSFLKTVFSERNGNFWAAYLYP